MPSLRSVQSTAFDVDFRGDKELLRLFEDLPDQMQRRAIRPALQKGAAELKKATKTELRKRTKKRTGNLLRSVETANVSEPAKGLIAFVVRFGSKNGAAGYHAHLVEFGHRIVSRGPDKGQRKQTERVRRKRRRRRKPLARVLHRKVRGKGFFRAAIGKNKDSILAEIKKRFRKELDKQVQRANAKAQAKAA